MASLQANTTWQARHGQFAEQLYLFIQTPLDRRGMASLQSNSTFSFEHHLTGEAWPVCRAILPLHSNTTCVACLAWSLYIGRTSTIAKNRHLNIVLQAELYLRTGTCTGYVVIRLDPPSQEKTPSPGDRRVYQRMASYRYHLHFHLHTFEFSFELFSNMMRL